MNFNQQPLALETAPPIARPGDYLSRLNYALPGNVQHIPIEAAPNSFADERPSDGSPDLPLALSGERTHHSDDLLPDNVQDQGEVCSSSQFSPALSIIESLIVSFALELLLWASLRPNRERGFDLTGWILGRLFLLLTVVFIIRFFWNLGATGGGNHFRLDEF